jgi:Animal haem peroxidase
MPRLPHGSIVTFEQLSEARKTLTGRSADIPLAFASIRPDDLQDFDFLFPSLQKDPANLLPESRETRDSLVALGQTMIDGNPGSPDGDSNIPAAYTYFGQFVDHDITLETVSAPLPDLIDPNLMPLPFKEIRKRIRNARTATLDLDSVYALPAPREGDKLRIGTVTRIGGTSIPQLRPPNKDDFNDLPREARNSDPTRDRAAIIGDPRNDENLIVGQLHVAFIRAHNKLIDQGKTFNEARTILRQHYQHIVLQDFLRRIADPQIVDRVFLHRGCVYDAMDEPFFLPLEFSVAAYRFGHSMVRAAYNFNLNFNLNGPPSVPATLELLFTFTALSGELGGPNNTVPENWIIEWENIIDLGSSPQMARRIDTKIVNPLFRLPDVQGVPEQGLGAMLAVRNLLRGYLLRMPTGQAVARALNQEPLTPEEIEMGAGSDTQIQALRQGGFLERTPLWYYILAEAASRAEGQHLGPVGSFIDAEVLVGLVLRSKDSILRKKCWTPTLPSAKKGVFTLADLLRFSF